MTNPAASPIIDGPSNLVLMASFLEPVRASFNVNGAIIESVLDWIQAEDASRYSWNIRGSYDFEGRGIKFEAYYNTKSKRGNFQPVERYSQRVKWNPLSAVECPIVNGPSLIKLGLALFEPNYKFPFCLNGNPVELWITQMESISADRTVWILNGTYKPQGNLTFFRAEYRTDTRKGQFMPCSVTMK